MEHSLREAIFRAIRYIGTTKGIEIIGSMFSDHKRLKLDIKNRKIAGE